MWSSLLSRVAEAGSVECFNSSLNVVLRSKLLDIARVLIKCLFLVCY